MANAAVAGGHGEENKIKTQVQTIRWPGGEKCKRRVCSTWRSPGKRFLKPSLLHASKQQQEERARSEGREPPRLPRARLPLPPSGRSGKSFRELGRCYYTRRSSLPTCIATNKIRSDKASSKNKKGHAMLHAYFRVASVLRTSL